MGEDTVHLLVNPSEMDTRLGNLWIRSLSPASDLQLDLVQFFVYFFRRLGVNFRINQCCNWDLHGPYLLFWFSWIRIRFVLGMLIRIQSKETNQN